MGTRDFESTDRLDDIATGLAAIATAAEELANDPPSCFQPQSIQTLTTALSEVSRAVSQLEEEREASASR